MSKKLILLDEFKRNKELIRKIDELHKRAQALYEKMDTELDKARKADKAFRLVKDLKD